MGCTTSSDVSGPDFTSDEKQLIRTTWGLFKQKGIEEGGAWLFVDLFRKLPETQDLFHFMQDVPVTQASLLASDEVRSHISRVFRHVESAVESLDNLGQKSAGLTDLGQRHAQYKVKPSYVEALGGCLIFALKTQLESTMTSEAEKAWVKIWLFMKAAFLKKLTQ